MELTKSLTIIKALADESRLQIIDALREKPQFVEELAERLNLAVSTVSFHLKKLESAGLVHKIKEQYYLMFYLNEKILKYSLDEITSFSNNEREIQEKRVRMYRDAVIRTFTKSGRITRLPVQHKKRIILYEQVLNLFEQGKVYPEKEIDKTIHEIYEDYCTIRRSFIDEKMMLRKNGIYQRNPEYILQFPGPVKDIKKGNKGMDRSDVKRTFKENLPAMGVYQLKNVETGNIFIGSAKNMKAIMNRHRFELSTKTHQIKELQDSWNLSEEKNLRFEIIDKLEPKEETQKKIAEDLKELENLWIDKFQKEGIKVTRLKNTSIA